MDIEEAAVDVVATYAVNGREAVNIIQIAAGITLTEDRKQITQADVEWVVNASQYQPRQDNKISTHPQIGCVNGLAVYGPNQGAVIEVEATATPTQAGQGKMIITGVMEEEELGGGMGVTLRRRSAARSSADNVITVLRGCLNLRPQDYDIHVNFPGGVPIDGPSAGVTMVTAIYSAITRTPVDNKVAMTGEVSIRGLVRPVGGIVAKLEAARLAGVRRCIIPQENWLQSFTSMSDSTMEIKPVSHIHDLLKEVLLKPSDTTSA